MRAERLLVELFAYPHTVRVVGAEAEGSAFALTGRPEPTPRHIDSITMTPMGEHYVAARGWKLVSIDGAGGQNRTGYARLFRAALYQ